MNYKVFFLMIVVICLIYIIYVLFNKKGYISSLNNAKNLITISPSSLDPVNNGTSNIYSLTIWFYVEDWNYHYGQMKPLLSRGSYNPSNTIDLSNVDCSYGSCTTNIYNALTSNHHIDNSFNAYPTIFLGENLNNLYIMQSLNGTDPHYVNTASSFIIDGGTSGNMANPLLVSVVENFPIQKWVNLTLSFYTRSLDIYLDGKLVKTTIYPDLIYIPSSASSTDTLITPGGGFNGMTSGFQYFTYSLNPDQVWDLYKKGYDNNSFFGDSLSKYKIKFSLMEGDIEEQSFQI